MAHVRNYLLLTRQYKDVMNYDQHPIFDKEDQAMAMDNDMMHDISMVTHLEDGCTFLDPVVDSSRPN